MPMLMISATHKSSGKTTITLGLCAALRHRGLTVQPFKKGPDYIDPVWLTQASGRTCYNLDFYTSTQPEILETVSRRSVGADIAIIEGNKGLFDGLDIEGTNSNAALARLLNTPVILVLDVRGTIRGVAPLLIGYQTFDPEINIAGVILNQVGGQRHEVKLRKVIQHYTDISVLGAIPRDQRLHLVERHLGLMPSNEDFAAITKIKQIRDVITARVELDRLQMIASSAPRRLSVPDAAHTTTAQDEINIGIVRDTAFGFYYPDDLEALERAGARLIPIDAIRDTRLPKIDGLFIGGGFPETQMDLLAANVSLREEIHAAIENGLPTYAECGGLMYLTRTLHWQGRRREMVGVIKADTVMHDHPQGRGYVRLRETPRHLWPSVEACSFKAEIAAHEFHYSSLEGIASSYEYAYRVLRGTGVDGTHDGIVYKNLLANYAHLRNTNQSPWTNRFIRFAQLHKQRFKVSAYGT